MIHDILFRAKKLTGEWVYGYLYITHTGEYEIGCYNKELDIERWTAVVDSSTVGQYTGLTDKNGVKIFEGDIVQVENPKPFLPYIRPVAYEDTCFIWGDYILGEYDRPERLEVIGNVWDSPGLLEENPYGT